jgi:hypothetical protein
MPNGAACCLLQVCCDRSANPAKYKAAMVKMLMDAGLNTGASERAYEALQPYDLVPAGTMDAYRNAIAAEARKHAADG